MQYKTVTSSESPASEQLLQGKLLINIDITSTTTTTDEDDITTYSFTQIVADSDADSDSAILEYRAEIAQEYLDSTDIYFTIDKYAQLTDARKTELTDLREEARIAIRAFSD